MLSIDDRESSSASSSGSSGSGSDSSSCTVEWLMLRVYDDAIGDDGLELDADGLERAWDERGA